MWGLGGRVQAAQDRLDGWKGIAAYLKRTPRTVQRWEKLEGLPVHRIGHTSSASVYAYPGEIDAWWNQRRALLETEVPGVAAEATQPPSASPWRAIATILAVVVAVAGVLAFSYLGRRPQADLDVTYPVRRGNVELAAISPDGKKAVYSWDVNNQHTLTLRDLDSGEERTLREGVYSRYYGFTFSAAGDALYFVAQQPRQMSALYRIPLAEGAETRVLENIDSPVTFSPGGRKMAFVRESDESRLVVANPDGTDVRPLTTRKRPEYLDYPAWSPDGRSIIASHVAPQGVRLIAVNPESGVERPVGDQVWDFVRFPAWLDSGTLAASVRPTRQDTERVARISFPSGRVEELKLQGDRFVTLSASADGRSLAGVVHQSTSSIWTTDGSNPPREILAPIAGSRGLAWSPDGRLLLGGSEISSVTEDGGHAAVVLKSTPVSNFAVCGAERLVYHRADGSAAGLWFSSLLGGGSKLIVPSWQSGRVSCSPDGAWILSSKLWAPVYQIPAAGGTEQVLIQDRVLFPVISWDDQWIAAYRSKTTTWGDPQEIAIYRRAGGPAVKTLAVHSGGFTWTPLRWTRDSKSIGYIERDGGADNVWAQPLDGGPGRRVTDFQGGWVTDFDWSPGGRLALELRTVARDLYLVRH